MSISGPLGATPESGAFNLSAGTLETRRRRGLSRTRAGQLGVAGLLITGLLLSIAAPSTDALLPESVRPIPTWLAGPFGATSFGLGVVPLLVLLSAMFGFYVLAAHHAGRLSARVVLMAIAALHAIVLLAPPLLSTDVFSYQAYARMGALYSTNPFLQGPHAIALDPVYPFIGAKWVNMPTAYGPLFTALSYVFAPLSIAASALAYKAIAALSSLIVVALVAAAARLRGLDPVRAAALVGLNPLVVLYGVGGGHNDLLMLALMVAGIYAMLAHRERAGGASLVLAAGIKLTAGLYGAFALAGAGGPRTRQRRADVAIGIGVATLLLAAVGFGLFGLGPLNLLSTISRGQSEGDWHSLAGFISTTLGLPTLGHIVGIALAVVFLASTLWLLRRVWRGQLDWIDGAGFSTLVMLLAASAIFPWYVAWLMPLAALASDRRLWRAAIILTGVVQLIQLFGYIPHGVGLGV